MLAPLDNSHSDTFTAQHRNGLHGGLDKVEHGIVLGNEE